MCEVAGSTIWKVISCVCYCGNCCDYDLKKIVLKKIVLVEAGLKK
jgi:hypothetical protein